MMAWLNFIVAFLAFFLSHSVPIRPRIRAQLIGILGQSGFGLLYSILSLAVLIWLVSAAAQAPYVAVWNPTPWHSWMVVIAMAVACLLVCFSIARPNPFSFGGARNHLFDPAHPGILRWVRHPLLMAIALWAGAHTIANGDLAHVILFGVFTGFALVGMRLVDRRKWREMGKENWSSLRHEVAKSQNIPKPISWNMLFVRLLVSLLLYLALIGLHPTLIGASPLP